MKNDLFDQATMERFAGFVDQRGEAECWPWTGRIGTAGYGIIKIKSYPMSAHRVALMYKLGRRLGADVQALHACDNKVCCNPAHIHPGTNADNRREAVERGRVRRWNGQRSGEGNPAAKLTQAKADAIRLEVGSNASVGAKYGVSGATVSAIRSGKVWANG